MKKQLYNAIYRLFEECQYGLTITVGQVSMSFWEPDKESCTVWEMGISANGKVYSVGSLFDKHLGPGSYAQLFAGEFDIINGLTEVIYAKEF